MLDELRTLVTFAAPTGQLQVRRMRSSAEVELQIKVATHFIF